MEILKGYRRYKEGFHDYREMIYENIFPGEGLRYVNYFLTHACNL